MNTSQHEKSYYSNYDWDERAWIEVIAVEYQGLAEGYPFDATFRAHGSGGSTSSNDPFFVEKVRNIVEL